MDYDYKTERQSCLECGSEFYGRPDKKFCSTGCKNRWHNRRTGAGRHTRNFILTALQINYNILRELLKQGSTSADLQELAIRGFNPGHITGHSVDRYGHNEYSCFDIVYCQSSSRIFNLRKAI